MKAREVEMKNRRRYKVSDEPEYKDLKTATRRYYN